MNPSDASRQLAVIARSELLAKVAREQLGMNLDAGVIAAAATGLGANGSGAFAEKPGVYSRLKGAVSYLVSGVTGQTWMGPFQPLPAMQDQPEKGTIGRAFDYQVGFNTQITPRQGEVSFQVLRNLAESYDLLRLAIETCKDQIESFEWEIVPEDDKADPAKFADEIRRVSEFLTYPDKEHNWNQWLRIFVEDMLVLDGVCIFPQQDRGGGLYSFDLIDPSTIKRVIDEYGRTPTAPSPAYQQVLKGIPAVDYTREQLVYIVRNPRSWKLYGYSPVEQIIMSVNIAMRRQVSQLQYYTEGNVPESLISAPDSWTAEQVKDFQMWWDSTLAGNTGQRRRMHFVPNLKDGKVVLTKGADQLKDDYDEWLAKIICYALSIAPSALIKQMNRASSEQIAESAKMEGQLPRMRFIASQLNMLIQTRLSAKGVKFKWRTDVAIDPLQKAQATKIYVDAKVVTPDEVRADDLGKPPLTPEEREAAWPAPVMEVKPGDEVLDAEGKPSEKGANSGSATLSSGKSAGSLPKKPSDGPQVAGKEPTVEKAEGVAADGLGKPLQLGFRKAGTKKLAPVVTAVGRAVAKRERSVMLGIRAQLRHHSEAIAAAAAEAYAAAGYPRTTKLAKVSDDEAFVLKTLEELGINDVSVGVLQALTAEIQRMYRQAGITGIAQVGAQQTQEMTRHLDVKAREYARTRGAELVTGIGKTTRERLRTTLTGAVERGDSVDALRKAIVDSTAFDEDRARMIARTELAKAHVDGNVAGWRETGEVEGKRSILGDLHDVPDECDECVEAGTVPLEDDFVDGYDFPPYHPNCICDILPVLSKEAP